jgi:transcriptional regulator with XRE-family HTH domain
VSETFGERLDRICTERKLSQKDLADMVGAPRASICRWLQNQRSPNYRLLIETAIGLNLSLDYLCGLTDEPRELNYVRPVSPAIPLQVQAALPMSDSWRTQLYSQED